MATDPDAVDARSGHAQQQLLGGNGMESAKWPRVRLTNVTKRFDDFSALRDISLEIERGSVFGIAGGVGAGKTTLLQVLYGELKPDTGKVEVFSQRSIGYFRGPRKLSYRQTVEDYLLSASPTQPSRSRPHSDYRPELIELAGLSGVESRRLRDLPAGIRRTSELVGALLADPDLVLLDELTIGLSSEAARQLWNLVVRLAQRGKTFVCTVHFMEEALRCDRVAYLFRSHLLACDAPGSIAQSAGSQSASSAWATLECDHVSLAQRIISSHGYSNHCAAFANELHLFLDEVEAVPEIREVLEAAGIIVTRFERTAPNLFDALDVLTEQYIESEKRNAKP